MCIPYLLDQTSLSNCHRTSGHAEQNSRRSRILATANIRVAHAHHEQTSCLKWCVSNGNIKWAYTICIQESTLSREVRHLLRYGGRSSCEIVERKRWNGLEVPCRYSFVAKRQLIKLKGLLQNQATASQFFVHLIKLAFLNALTITKDFNENPEFNKRRSRLVAALE